MAEYEQDSRVCRRFRSCPVAAVLVGCLASPLAAARTDVDPGRFEKQVIVAAATDPMQLDLAPDGRVFFIERAGAIKVWLPDTQSVIEAGRLDVGLFGEVGLMGFALSHDFATNPRAFALYCPAENPDVLRLAVFSVVGDQLDAESERVLIEYPIDKDFAVHMGGGLAVSDRGELFVGTGDNTIPIPELPLDERPGHEHLDARRSSGNTDDLRGKILRILPDADGGYAIPEGNLFPQGEGGRPEIYAMGCRNPFRISYDNATRTLYWGDVGPNISMDPPVGPNGYDEFNATQQPGNFGWPLFVGPNEAYRDFDFATGTLGDPFVPERPVNDSRNNTGAQVLPPAKPAFIWYPSEASPEFPELGSGGRSAMAGPVYRVADAKDEAFRLPEHYDGALLVHDWTRNWIKAVWRDASGRCERIEPFMPGVAFRKPIQLRLAPDGTLYLIEFGDKWFDNRDAQIVRVVYRRGNRPPEPVLTASVSVGKAPLTTTIDATGTVDRDGEDDLKWTWRVDGETVPDVKGPVLDVTLEDRGRHTVAVEVTDGHGATGVAATEVSVGNAPPEVTLAEPLHGSFFDWAEVVKYRATVSDEEDGRSVDRQITDSAVVVRATYQQRRRSEADDDSLAPGLALMRGSTCFSCHSTSSGGGGPAYQLVAKRYAGVPGAVEKLADKVVRGGAGVWGKKAMPGHPNVNLADAQLMVTWVLGLATDRTRQVLSGHDGAFLAPERPAHRGDAGVLRVEAEYRDLGAEEIPPAAGVATAVLHTRRKKPAFADRLDRVDVVDVFEGESALVGFFDRGGYAAFADMRPELASGIRVRGRSTADIPTAVEVRLNRPDGPLLGVAELPPGEYSEAEITYEAPPGLHDLYVVAASGPEGPGGPVAAVSWLEFMGGARAAPPTKVVVAPLTTDDPDVAAKLQTWCELVAKTINQVDDAVALVSPDADWPTDQRVIADSRVVVLCQALEPGSGVDAIPSAVAEQVALMRQLGVGVVFLQLVAEGPDDSMVQAFVEAAGEASTPRGSVTTPLASALSWPVVESSGTAWLALNTEAGEQAIAWSEAPLDAGRRVRFALPRAPGAMLEAAVRDNLLSAVLWAAWRDADAPPATWLDPALLRDTPTASAETAVADYSKAVPGGWLLPPSASTSAPKVDGVFWLIAGVSVACAAPITLAMCGLVVVYRRETHAAPQPSPSHNNWLEASWSLFPAIIVVGIFHAGLVGYLDLRTPPVNCYEIGVTAQKWSWSFHYPGGHVEPDLHVPAGRPVKLVMSSADVIHSVFIPAFRLKMDCVPGRYSTAWFEATEPTPDGHSHPLYCAEYCGTNHSQMLASVVVHEKDEFDDWLAEAGDLTSRLPPVEAGKVLYRRRGCVQCHSIDGSRRSGGGPTFLKTFGTTQSLASGAKQVIDENYIRESILNPMAKVRAGYRPVMPTYQGQLRETEISALVAFIKSLAGTESRSNEEHAS